MAISDDDIEMRKELRYGDDTTPLVALVPDQPTHWGKLTSAPRTASPQYLEFLKRHKEVRDGRERGLRR